MPKPNNLIYALLDPSSKEVRYIGKSTSGLLRAKSHFSPVKLNKDNTYKGKWLRSLGQDPGICILTIAETKEELNQLEIDYIALYKALGARLTNLTEGGEGTPGNVLSEESRDKIRQRQLLRYAKMEGPPIPHNRKYHILIDDILYKNCGNCLQNKILSEFGSYIRNWDKLHTICKICRAEKQAEYRVKNPEKRLTKEEWLRSYKNRDTRNKRFMK